jgi:N-acyl-D-amino-acid deacylase
VAPTLPRVIALVLAIFSLPAMAQTGRTVPELHPVDEAVAAFMKRWQLPGGAVAIARGGRLILAHGYGLADREQNRPVAPDSPFRLASLGKPVTAAAVMKLVEDGRLGLDDRLVDALAGAVRPPPNGVAPRVESVTIRHLLQHTSGWGAPDTGYGTELKDVLARMGSPRPPWDMRALAGTALGMPPRWAPGSRHEYSTFGYCTLGLVIEKASGTSFERYVQETLFAPAQAHRVRLARRTRAEAWPGEVVYYDHPDAPSSGSRDETGRRVPRPYAYWGDIAGCDSGGRWVGSTVDYLRFLLALTGRRGPALLRPDTLRVMDDRMSMLPRGTSLAGLGWALYADGGDLGWSHAGSLPGSMSQVVHSFHGVDWIASSTRARSSMPPTTTSCG